MNFKDFVSIYKSVWGIILASATTGPFVISAFTDLAPPWPRNMIGGFGVVVSIIAIMSGYLTSSRVGIITKKLSKKKHELVVRKATWICYILLILSLMSLMSYAGLYSLYVVSWEQKINGETTVIRRVVGTKRLSAINPDIPDKEAIMYAPGLNPSEVWTPYSLMKARLLLLLTFLSIFFLINLSLTILAPFTHMQRNNRAK